MLSPQAKKNRTEPELPRRHRWFHLEKMAPAFWTITGSISLVVNIFLICLLVAVASQLFSLRQLLMDQLVGGLYGNFILMDRARIQTTIPVNTEVIAKFDLPLDTDTTVTLTEDVSIQGASVTLLTGGLTILNAPTNIILPKGTRLPVHLKLSVPVNEKIPVNLEVKVDIPLNQTDLHYPFVGLQQVVSPYYYLLYRMPDSWNALLCGNPADKFCSLFFKK
jgi:hypothetical protein